MRVADIGSGTGFFAVPAVGMVGPKGRVYAIDLSAQMLEDLREKLERAGAGNLETLRSEEDRIPLPDASVDFAFLACVLHELDGPGTLLEVRRILKPGGRLGIVDWKKEESVFGPPKAHRLDEDEARAVLSDAGFEPTRTLAAQTMSPTNIQPKPPVSRANVVFRSGQLVAFMSSTPIAISIRQSRPM